MTSQARAIAMATLADRSRLRAVASEHAEIVNSEEMAARRERWRLSDRLLQRTVPFHIEDNGPLSADLPPVPKCEGQSERGCEPHFPRCITSHRLIPDDRVFPAGFWAEWRVSRTPVCSELRYRRVPDTTGRELGYETTTPLAALEPGRAKLRPSEFTVNRNARGHRAGGRLFRSAGTRRRRLK